MPREVIGFLHGLDENSPGLNDSLVALLRPQNWRLYKFVTYDFVRPFDAEITYGLSNHYAWSQGGFPEAKPWLDWEGYEDYIADELHSIRVYFPNRPPEFYDIWSEPDHPYYWTGTYEQLLELFYRAHNVVKAHNPQAKLVGPSVAKYVHGSGGVSDIVAFVADLDSLYGIRLDALSWHENESGNYGGDRPEHIIGHVQQIRSDLAARFPPDYEPELHVNEHVGNQVHLSPGYNVGYLYYLIEAEIDAAMRACWHVYTGWPAHPTYWSDCWNGLDGMFMPDDCETPQPPFWVYKAYADMMDGDQLSIETSSATTPALASRHDSTETLRVLVGRYYHAGACQVIIEVEGYPYDHENVTIRFGRIPHYPEFFEIPYPKAIPLPGGPVDAWETTRDVVGGSFAVPIGIFEDNDAWVLEILETETSDIASEPASRPVLRLAPNYPNPFNPGTTIGYDLPPPAGRVRLSIYDARGRLVRTLVDRASEPGPHEVCWDGSDDAGRRVSSGVYFCRLTWNGGSETQRMVLLR